MNWTNNYKTGLKNVYFRMKAGNKAASIGIEITRFIALDTFWSDAKLNFGALR